MIESITESALATVQLIESIGDSALATNGGPTEDYGRQLKLGMVALSVGLAAFGAGYAERGIGAAAVGAMAEDESLFGKGLIMTVLPETLVIFAIVVIFLV